MMLYKHKQFAKMITMLFLLFAVAINLFAQKIPKANFIIADGIPADVIERNKIVIEMPYNFLNRWIMVKQ